MKKLILFFAGCLTLLSTCLATYGEDDDWGYRRDLLKVPERPEYASDELVDEVAAKLNIDFTKIDRKEFARGMMIELEHGKENPATDVTNDDPILTAKIVLAHLNELPNYYTLLEEMEEEAEEHLRKHDKKHHDD